MIEYLNAGSTVVMAFATVIATWFAYLIYRMQKAEKDGEKPDVKFWVEKFSEEKKISVAIGNEGNVPLSFARVHYVHPNGVHLKVQRGSDEISSHGQGPVALYVIAGTIMPGDFKSMLIRLGREDTNHFEAVFTMFNGKIKRVPVDVSNLGPYCLNDYPES